MQWLFFFAAILRKLGRVYTVRLLENLAEGNIPLHGHYYTYYYGRSHLAIKMITLARSAASRGMNCVLIGDDVVREMVIRGLEEEFDDPQKLFCPGEYIIDTWRKHGTIALRKTLVTLLGRSQGLCIGADAMVELVATGVSLAEFLKWERAHNLASRGLSLTTICFYPFKHDDPDSLSDDEFRKWHHNHW
jgi:hypothetical protein